MDFRYERVPDGGGDFLLENLNSHFKVQNLDRFLSKVYAYYFGKGFNCITAAKGLNLLALIWEIFLTSFLLTCINYPVLFETYQLSAAIQYQGFHPFLLICVMIFCAFWTWQCVQFIIETRENLDIRHFYQYELKISEVELQTMEWSEVVQRVILVPSLCPLKKESISPLDIANRIMRKENYLIAMINKGILRLEIPLPYLREKSVVTKTVEWALSFAIFSYVFDPKALDGLNKQFLNSSRTVELTEGLRQRFRVIGVLGLLLSPFLFVFLFVYFLFKYGEEFRSRPASFAMRQWSPLARWKLRELNELPHIFQRRLNASFDLAEKFVASFTFNLLTIVARFFSFVIGSVVVVLLLLGLWDEEALFKMIIVSNKTALWFVGIGGTIVAICRAVIPDENKVLKPAKIMEELVQYTHYMPKSWRNRTHTVQILDEFTELFQYKAVIFLYEMFSVLFAPSILLFSLPKCAEDVVVFFRDFTINEDGVGDICKFGVFPLEEHGNPHYGVDSNCPKTMQTKQGKLEKSFLSFKANNPDWKPSRDGEKYLENVSQIISSSLTSEINDSKQTSDVNLIRSLLDQRPSLSTSTSTQSYLSTGSRKRLEESVAALNTIYRHLYSCPFLQTLNVHDPNEKISNENFDGVRVRHSGGNTLLRQSGHLDIPDKEL